LQPRDIIAIGGSAGSIEAVNTIVSGLPPGFPASIFIVLHVSPDSPSMLPALLSRRGPLPASSPADGEPIQPAHIYVARPDHHLTIEDGMVRVLRGPRENRHRPAIDPLFRTAAREYGPRAVGIVLSGLQDDGSAGLFAVRKRDGIAIVQDPREASFKDMPAHAIEYAKPDYILPSHQIASILVALADGQQRELAMARKNSIPQKSNGRKPKHKKASSAAALGKPEANEYVAYPDQGEGAPSVFACPECHGVLWELKDQKMVRFRCRVGHSYGPESLTRELSIASEAALWAAVRALEEKSALQRRVADSMRNDAATSIRLLDQSNSDSANALRIREMIFHRDAELGPTELQAGEAEASESHIA
jgi:two-component system chemotaxis response regulator CheB